MNQRLVIVAGLVLGFLILTFFVMALRNVINETLLESGGWLGRVSTILSRA